MREVKEKKDKKGESIKPPGTKLRYPFEKGQVEL